MVALRIFIFASSALMGYARECQNKAPERKWAWADLPCGQAEEAAHAEDGEVKDPGVGALVRVPHLLLPDPHLAKVLGGEKLNISDSI